MTTNHVYITTDHFPKHVGVFYLSECFIQTFVSIHFIRVRKLMRHTWKNTDLKITESIMSALVFLIKVTFYFSRSNISIGQQPKHSDGLPNVPNNFKVTPSWFPHHLKIYVNQKLPGGFKNTFLYVLKNDWQQCTEYIFVANGLKYSKSPVWCFKYEIIAHLQANPVCAPSVWILYKSLLCSTVSLFVFASSVFVLSRPLGRDQTHMRYGY